MTGEGRPFLASAQPQRPPGASAQGSRARLEDAAGGFPGAVRGARTSECLHCGVQFVPTRAGHLYCTPACRHQGPRSPHDREPVNHEQVARLFDEDRDPDELVRPDDWHPLRDLEHGEAWVALDACRTVHHRRGWYLSLLANDML